MGGRGLTGWFDVPSLDGTAGEDAVGFAESTEVVMRLVESEVQRGVPPNNIFLREALWLCMSVFALSILFEALLLYRHGSLSSQTTLLHLVRLHQDCTCGKHTD